MTANQATCRRRRTFAAVLFMCGSSGVFQADARADDYRLVADTKISISIVQWNPSKGEYQRWEALGGAFQVSQQGAVGLPVVGSLEVGGKTTTEVAAQISAALRDKMGLLSAPDVTVEIAQYPAIYVVGAVTTPGSYTFTPGLTALQALAVAGGRFRPPAGTSGQNDLSLLGELDAIRISKLGLIGRIARLQAEIAGDSEIRFPPELTDNRESVAEEIIALERMVFAARANETTRQATKLGELRDMYTRELEMMAAKQKDSRKELSQTEKEVSGLTSLVEKGVITTSRWSEMRRMLAQMRAVHGEGDIEAMRARQNLNETTRQEFGIRDQRQTEVATQLRDAQGDLAGLNSRQETIRQLLLVGGTVTPEEVPGGDAELRLVVVRRGQQGSTELNASEATLLLPGDVLKVQIGMTPSGAAPPDASASPAPGVSQ